MQASRRGDRARNGIDEEIVTVDWGCVYWQRER
jgi:hypothetical protein